MPIVLQSLRTGLENTRKMTESDLMIRTANGSSVRIANITPKRTVIFAMLRLKHSEAGSFRLFYPLAIQTLQD